MLVTPTVTVNRDTCFTEAILDSTESDTETNRELL